MCANQTFWIRDLSSERLDSVVAELTSELDPMFKRAGEIQFGVLSEKNVRDWISAHPGCVSFNKA
jgi:hypothetical protein